jgi:hypothetical protein
LVDEEPPPGGEGLEDPEPEPEPDEDCWWDIFFGAVVLVL